MADEASPELVEVRAQVRNGVLGILTDMEQHKTTSLCFLGNSLIAGATIYAVSPWPTTWPEAGIHVIPILATASVGYLLLHVGKCLMAPR